MPHFRVDDALHSHPKAQRAGDEAMGMWVRAGSYCMAYLTDGFVPLWWVKQQPKGTAKARKLIAAGLWIDGVERDGEKGYQFHEFTGPGRQDSRAQVEEERRKWREKKAAQRAESQGESPGDNGGESPGDNGGESPGDKKSADHGPDLFSTENASDSEHFEGQNGTRNARYNGGYTSEKPTRNSTKRNAPTSADTDLSPEDRGGESPYARARPPAPTQPNPTTSSGHLDDDYARDDEPPENPWPEHEPVIVDDHPAAPEHVDTPARPARRHPSSAARTVVRQTLGNTALAAYPRRFLDRLATQVDRLAHAGHPDTLIRQALTEWDTRPDARPEWLESVYGDVVKNTRATNGHTTHDAKVNDYLALANAHTPQEIQA